MANGAGRKHRVYPLVLVEVLVRTKPSVPNPEAAHILANLGSEASGMVTAVSRAKYFQIKLAHTTLRKARADAGRMAKSLLANAVTEDFEIQTAKAVSP